MTGTIRITDLPNAGVLAGTERTVLVDGAVAMQATTQQIANLARVTVNEAVARSITSFGASPEASAAVNTAAFAAAFDWIDENGGGTIIIPAAGSPYLVNGLVGVSNLTLVGEGAQSIIKLANGANAHTLAFTSGQSHVTLMDFTVDGNKSNQSIGVGRNYRGIYFLGDCTHLYISGMRITNTVDHGLFLSDGASVTCGDDSLIIGCEAYDCGLQAHLDAGGAGGTGIVGGTDTTIVTDCWGHGNILNGFKSARGNFINCISHDNGAGFETGFLSTPQYGKATFIGCRAQDNDRDGFRNQGQGDEILIMGCIASGNGESGIALLNGVQRGQIIGNRLSNNGWTGVRTSTKGIDGLTVFASGATGPSNITICNNQIFDDQAIPTQAYGIYIDDNVDNIVVNDDNIVGTQATGAFYIASTSTFNNIFIRGFPGYSGFYKSATATTVTGTTSLTDMKTVTLKANEFKHGSLLKVRGGGTTTGTNGTKIIRFQMGAVAVIVSNQAAGENQPWAADITILFADTTSRFAMVNAYEFNGTSSLLSIAVNNSLTADLVIKFTGQLGNSADTVSQGTMIVTTEN